MGIFGVSLKPLQRAVGLRQKDTGFEVISADSPTKRISRPTAFTVKIAKHPHSVKKAVGKTVILGFYHDGVRIYRADTVHLTEADVISGRADHKPEEMLGSISYYKIATWQHSKSLFNMTLSPSLNDPGMWSFHTCQGKSIASSIETYVYMIVADTKYKEQEEAELEREKQWAATMQEAETRRRNDLEATDEMAYPAQRHIMEVA